MAQTRRIRVAEAGLVRELVRAAVREDAEQHPEDRVGISEDGLANLETQFRIGAAHEDEVTLVAVEADEIVGFITGWLSRGRAIPGVRGETDWLWVRPGTSRAEIERQLADAATTWLFDRGALARSSRRRTSDSQGVTSGRRSVSKVTSSASRVTNSEATTCRDPGPIRPPGVTPTGSDIEAIVSYVHTRGV